MANASTAYGARLYRALTDADPIILLATVDSSNDVTITPGDFLTREADGNVTRAAAGEAILGVAQWVRSGSTLSTAVTQKSLPVSTAGFVGYIDGAAALWRIKTDADGAGAEIGSLYDFTDAAGSTYDGRSRQVLDTSTEGTSTGQLRIEELVDEPRNTQAAAYQDVIVKINEAQGAL